MILQRKLTRTGFNNGISYRVEACRKRLRTIRTCEAQTRIEEYTAELEFEAATMKREARAATFRIESQERDEAGIT